MCGIIKDICSKCLEPALNFVTAETIYIRKFEDNLDELKNALEDLKAKRDDVLTRVDAEEVKGGKRLNTVKRWLSKVQIIETDTNQLVAEASLIQERVETRCFCSYPFVSAYFCGRQIPKKLVKVENLSSKGDFELVVNFSGAASVAETNSDQQTFGLDTKLQRVWSCLMEDGIRMLGLYGMGGVGKTTLLTHIKNMFVAAEDHVVIWVKVSKHVHISEIQDNIGKTLGLYDEKWSKEVQKEKAGDIHRVLKYNKPRFVLLLDDLWEEISLTHIGIPLQGKEYKVVFTTRIKDLCGRMGANEDIEVECLAENHAWDLFEQKARCGRLHEDIYGIAKKNSGYLLWLTACT